MYSDLVSDIAMIRSYAWPFYILSSTQWIEFKTSGMEYITNGNDKIWIKVQADKIQKCLFGNN